MLSKITKTTFAMLSGIGITLGSAPFNYWLLGLLSPALLFHLLYHEKDSKRAIKLMLVFSISLFGSGVSWVFNSIYFHSDTHIIIAILLTSLLIVYLSSFHLAHIFLLNVNFKGAKPLTYALAFSGSWVIVDVARSFLFTGFPWLFVGYTQFNSPIINYAPICGIYGVSFLTILSGCFIAIIAEKKSKNNIFYIIFLFLLFGIGNQLSTVDWTKAKNKVNIALVQGNISPDEKFLQKEPIKRIWQIYGKPSLSLFDKNIVVWPENAIAYPWPYAQGFIGMLQKQLKEKDAILISGIPKMIDRYNFYNSMITVSATEAEFYHKRQLLIFGDYVPFQNLLRGLIDFFDLPMSNFTHGPKDQKLISINETTLSPFICYEIAYPMLVSSSVNNATAIINLSEDGWFGNSLGPHQHFDIARMRAIETGKTVIRSTPSGISAIIDHKGKVTDKLKQFKYGILKTQFENREGNTPLTKTGHIPYIGIILFINLVALLMHKRKLT